MGVERSEPIRQPVDPSTVEWSSPAVQAKTTVSWAVFGLLTLGIINAYIDRVNLSVALPEMTRAFDAPIKAIGVWLLIGAASYVFLVREKYAPRSRDAQENRGGLAIR